MKIALISDYPPFICGIARYTRYLAKALCAIEDVELCVISEQGQADADDPFPVFDTYSRQGNYQQSILQKIDEEKPALVHFQHDPSLFPNTPMLLALIEEISKREIAIWLTVHTADVGKTSKIDWKHFYATVLAHGHIIVHNSMSIQSIARYGLPTHKVHVIAHGTEFLDLPDKTVARARLNLDGDEFVFLLLGFIHALKNHHTVISAFRKMTSRTKCRLLIAGSAGGGRWYNKLYIQACRVLGLGTKAITRHNIFIKDEQMADYLAASDVMLLPYWQNYPSASGIFHLALGARLPVICSDSVKFSEIKPYLHDDAERVFVPMLKVSKWARAMTEMADNPSTNSHIAKALNRYANETSWKNIAMQHWTLFKNSVSD